MTGLEGKTSPHSLATHVTAGGTRQKINQLVRKTLSLLFLAAIAAPLIGTWPNWQPWHAFNEKRQLAEFPAQPTDLLQAASYPSNILSFYRDHFGFRDTLIHALMLAKVGLLHANDNPQVILGNDGWLFLRLTDGPGAHDYDPLAPLTESELSDWQDILLRRYNWLTAMHISYLMVIVPEKQTIYPEFLPADLRRQQSHPWIDQFIDRIHKANSSVRILDLRPYLLQGKRHEPVFWTSDTHWNPYGTYIGYRAIMNEIRRILPNNPPTILDPKDFKRFPDKRSGGDLANLLGAPELFGETYNAMVPPDKVMPPRGLDDPLYAVNGNPRMPRLVMYHDSFGVFLVPLMARSFSHGVYCWGGYDLPPDFIPTQKPDLVIEEIAERYLTARRWALSSGSGDQPPIIPP